MNRALRVSLHLSDRTHVWKRTMLKQVLYELRKYRGVNKDPISLVMELGQITRKSPTFVIANRGMFAEGEQFLCKASFLYLDKESLGNSKQNSKRAACIEILKSLMEDMDEDISLYEGTLFSHADIQAAEERSFHSTKSVVGKENYVGQLQEYAQKKNISLPVYTDCKEQGPAHQKSFTTEVKLPASGLQAIGVGPTKKIAKANAAKALYEQLPLVPSAVITKTAGASSSHVIPKQDAKVIFSGGSNKEFSNLNGIVDSSQQSRDSKPSSHPDRLTESTPITSELQIGSKTVNVYNAVSTLLQWGKSHNVNISYHEQASKKPLWKLVFVKVSVVPPVVSAGEGRTIEEAYAHGAMHVLEQLFSMGYSELQCEK